MDAKQEIERMARTYANLILRLSYARLGSTHDAQDICQTVFLKLLGAIKRGQVVFVDDRHEKSWVIRATINACKDLQRSAWKRKIIQFGEGNDIERQVPTLRTTHEGGANEAGIEDEAQKKLVDVRRAINKLPAKYREAVYLHYYEGLALNEIALLTGEKSATIGKRLSRARKKLRNLLESPSQDEGRTS